MWRNIIGQDNAVAKLRSIYTAGRIAHAYLFYGNEGIGKDAAAIEFAKLINCTSVKNEEACDKCDNCKKISSFRSEYFHFICALPAGRSEQIDSDPLEKLESGDYETYLEQVKFKSENPYHHVNIPGANNIRINSIRDLINRIYFTSGKHFKKVFLISEADKMKQEAANALLKVLEEPPRNSILILTTSKINALPQTVTGRCQKIYFEPLPTAQIKDMLTSSLKNNSMVSPEEEIDLAARLSTGSYVRAIELLGLGISDIREQAVNFLVALLKDNPAETVSIIRTVTSRNDKERTKYFLVFLTIWFRDLLLMKYNGNANLTPDISNKDIADRLSRFNSNYPDTDIFSIINDIEESVRQLSQNVQLNLILINLAFKLRKYIK
ncbi:MAG: AAA family ATPase [Ignavibacteria bacterium]|jgi:DNA polymerase-3 subunit delta'